MYSTKIEIPAYPEDLPDLIRLGLEPEDKSTIPSAQLVFEGEDTAWFELGGITFEVRSTSPRALVGDVILVNRLRGTGDRLIRQASQHNTLLITERCDQICVMCSQPPKDYELDLFDTYRAALLYAPQQAVIGISGGEPLLYKAQLFELIRHSHKARPDLGFHILTNGQHLTPEDLPDLAQLPLEQITFAVPLYASEPALHDRIVGKEGAFAQVLTGLCTLMEAGAEIEVRTVLMQPNAKHLPDLAQFLAWTIPDIAHWAIMQMEYIGYARKNWGELFFDHSVESTDLGRAVAIADQHGLDCQLYNMPLCTLGPELRGLAPRTISDWKQKFLAPCQDCPEQGACSGFFAWQKPELTFRNLGPHLL